MHVVVLSNLSPNDIKVFLASQRRFRIFQEKRFYFLSVVAIRLLCVLGLVSSSLRTTKRCLSTSKPAEIRKYVELGTIEIPEIYKVCCKSFPLNVSVTTI